MIKKAKHLYYRGSLSSCNYACYYCPFAKKTHTQQDLLKDQKALHRFYDFVKETTFEESISLLITPYGEAMIHDYYMDMVISFAKLEKINVISIQTNLSFDVEKFLEKVKASGVDRNKIKFWATFHPTMISMEEFAARIQLIDAHFEVCVGIVAVREDLGVVASLKELLPQHIYFWLNAQAKCKSQYTKAVIEALRKIDPCFQYEFDFATPTRKRVALSENMVELDDALCSAGKGSFLIEANGDVRACHENRQVMFNIYKETGTQANAEFCCKRRLCDCYLAYSNLKVPKMKHLFGDQLPIRIPQRHTYQAIFLDIDGTLTDSNGKLRDSVVKTLEQFKLKSKPNHQHQSKHKSKQNTKLYFVTALPYEKAHRKCNKLWSLFSGGVFSNGAYVVEFDANQKQQYAIDAEEADSLLMGFGSITNASQYISIDKSPENEVLRVILPRAVAVKITEKQTVKLTEKQTEKLTENLAEKPHLPNSLRFTYERQKAYIQQSEASKVNGIEQILKWCEYNTDSILVMGNSENDLEMVQRFKHSAATLNAPKELRKAARYVLEVVHLPYICER